MTLKASTLIITAFVLSFFKICPSLAATQGPPMVGDRIVVEVNALPYSQRQIETYILVKKSLASPPGNDLQAEDFLASPKNWTTMVAVFVEDMVIQQEAQRLGSFQATERSLEAAKAEFAKILSQNKQLNDYARRLDLSDRGLIRTISTALRAEGFRRSRERQLAGEGADLPAAQSATDAAWLTELKERAIVRHFATGLDFFSLSPFPGKARGPRK